MTTQIRTPDGAELTVRVEGPTNAPALLLLQGQANPMRWWDRVRTGFEDTYRTVTFDYRGTGTSAAEVDAWTTDSFAEDAALVMDRLGVEQYAVYGTSMGGRIAQHLAARHRDAVTHLILACTSPGGLVQVPTDPEATRILTAPRSPERTEAVIRLFYTDEWAGSIDVRLLLGDPDMTAEARRAHQRCSAGHDAWSLLPQITAPTLVFHGTDDLMVPPANAELIESAILGARLMFVEGGRHGFFDEFADDLLPVLREFLR